MIGTDVAIECADIVLMRNNLKDVATAIHLSKATFKRIQYNFLWAFGYNILAIPLAAGVFFPVMHTALPPMAAGFAMVFLLRFPLCLSFTFHKQALSSVSVVVSSLLLRWYKKPTELL